MEKKKKNGIALTFVLGIIGVSLLIASFATDRWVKSSPSLNRTVAGDNSSQQGSPTGYTGNITFGLFRGFQVLDFGVGARTKDIFVVCSGSLGFCMWANNGTNSTERTRYLEYLVRLHNKATASTNEASVKNDMINGGLFDFGLWVTTIVMLALAIVWGLVSLGFTAFNLLGKPIETITGPTGLYLWNGLAFTFALMAVLVYVGLFVKDISKNLLSKEYVDVGWRSEGHTWLDYSFYMVVGSSAAFLLSDLVLILSGQKFKCNYSHAAEKEIDGMILY